MEYPARNEIKMGLQSNIINIQIIAISDDMARKLYEMIKQMCTELVRVDLELDWRKDNET